MGSIGCVRLRACTWVFFIDAQHHGVVGRVEIEAHDVAHFLDEERVIGELEVALSMGLNAEQGEPALHGTFRYTGMLGHRAHTPVGVFRRARLQRLVDHLRHPLVLETSRSAGPQFLMQALDTEFPIAPSPLADRSVGQLHPSGDGTVCLTIGARQNDLCASHQTVGQRRENWRDSKAEISHRR